MSLVRALLRFSVCRDAISSDGMHAFRDIHTNVRVYDCRSMQVIQLDKHIRLLDSPGVVVATQSSNDEAMVLRNCIRVSDGLVP